MPRIKLTKNAIDSLPTPKVVVYRIGGAGSKPRKYTIGPYGRVTLHQARVDGAESVRGKAGRARSGSREARGQATDSGGPGRGSIGSLHRATAITEPIRRRDFAAASSGGGKALGRQEHS